MKLQENSKLRTRYTVKSLRGQKDQVQRYASYEESRRNSKKTRLKNKRTVKQIRLTSSTYQETSTKYTYIILVYHRKLLNKEFHRNLRIIAYDTISNTIKNFYLTYCFPQDKNTTQEYFIIPKYFSKGKPQNFDISPPHKIKRPQKISRKQP